jgi:hypothetical protein
MAALGLQVLIEGLLHSWLLDPARLIWCRPGAAPSPPTCAGWASDCGPDRTCSAHRRARLEPARDERTLGLGHLRGVVQRHELCCTTCW